MQNTLSYFMLLAKRWWWLVALGIVLCGGTTYVISKKTHSVYRATATLIVNFQTSPSSYDSITAGVEAVPTYAQLLTSPTVLQPVLALHPGMRLKELNAMITVTPKPNSQLIELDVENTNPTLAMNLANEISNQFVQYVNPQLTASVQPVYAVLPVDPVRPKPLQDGGIGALVGLGLALSLIFLFEWIDDRLAGPEEVQNLLGMETLAIIPRLSRRQRLKSPKESPDMAEACRMLCASLSAAQAIQPFKLVMVTSALAGEGKSTIAANLASFLAFAGKRVLLVDADLRRPVQSQHFQLANSVGLSDILGQVYARNQIEVLSQATDIPTLRVLTAGVASSNSAELLQSPLVSQVFDYFKKAPFDYILFDTPPLLPVADAQFLASRIQTAVVVVDASKTPRKILLRAKSVFNRTHTTILGVAINKCHWPEYGYIRDYQRYVRQSKTMHAITSPNTLPAGDVVDTPIPSTPPESVADIPATVAHHSDMLEDIDIPETPPSVDEEVRTTIPEITELNKVDPDVTIVLPRLKHIPEKPQE